MKTKNFKTSYLTKAVIVMVSFSILMGCNTVKNMNRSQKGAAIGVGAGAALGAGIGKLAGNTGLGAILGAAVGGASGAVIGKYMDKQAKEMEAQMQQNAKVERVAEGIRVTFDSGLLFPVNSSELSAKSKMELVNFASILNKYPETNITISGHTDDTGTAELNQTLSEKRAASVANQLSFNKVDRSRMTTRGFGKDQPIVENNSAANRALNRRVEVIIVANQDLVNQAKNGTLEVK